MDWIDTKYTSLISPFVRNYRAKSNSLYNFSCPFCGDSKLNKTKARGYLYFDDEFKYKCHNCGVNLFFGTFLKKLNPSLYKQYRLEKVKTHKRNETFSLPKTDVKEELEKRKESIESIFEPLDDECLAYLNGRKITKLDDLWMVSEMSNFSDFFPDKKLPSDKRIVFPIRNRRKEVIGLSARSINPMSKLRYVLLKYKDEPLIYGLDKVDLSKPVYILEGAIDSLHLDNAVAVNGSDLIKVSEFIQKKNQILVYDNQPRNKEIISKMLSACEKKYRMVIWPKNLSEKDINSMIQKYDWNVISRWLENIYEGMACRAKIIDWKKI